VWAVLGRFFQSLPLPCGASPDIISPNVNQLQRKRKSGDSLIFWSKRFGRQKKKYTALGQPKIFFFFFCIDQDYLFFLLATIRPN
jgi:hypothetical protein